MATEQPKNEPESEGEESERDLDEEGKTEDGATVEEQSEQSFPASDPPSY